MTKTKPDETPSWAKNIADLRLKLSEQIKLEEVFMNGFVTFEWELNLPTTKYKIIIRTARGEKNSANVNDVVDAVIENGKQMSSEQKAKFLAGLPNEVHFYIFSIHGILSDVVLEKISIASPDFSLSQ